MRAKGAVDPQVASGLQHLRPLDPRRRRPASRLASLDAKLQGLLAAHAVPTVRRPSGKAQPRENTEKK
jgi:hypothetical protein